MTTTLHLPKKKVEPTSTVEKQKAEAFYESTKEVVSRLYGLNDHDISIVSYRRTTYVLPFLQFIQEALSSYSAAEVIQRITAVESAFDLRRKSNTYNTLSANAAHTIIAKYGLPVLNVQHATSIIDCIKAAPAVILSYGDKIMAHIADRVGLPWGDLASKFSKDPAVQQEINGWLLRLHYDVQRTKSSQALEIYALGLVPTDNDLAAMAQPPTLSSEENTNVKILTAIYEAYLMATAQKEDN